MPGAEPYHHDGGPVGVLLVHGFTSTPQSMRSWAEFLASHGLTVSLPRLPGHGTRWQECNVTGFADWYATVEKEFLALTERCHQVFVMGQSMGGTLTLRLAQQYGNQEHGKQVAGIVLVNPSVMTLDPRMKLLPVLARLLPSFPPIAGDIKKPGAAELAYERLPLKALRSLQLGWELVKTDLPQVTQPVLLMHSPEDHVVEPANSQLIMSKISSRDLHEVLLLDSYHVATLDNEAGDIHQASLDFVRRLAPAAAES